MDNPTYIVLSRQSGLERAMDAVANNIANLSTTGFRREGAVFAEMIRRLDETDGGGAALTAARVRVTEFTQGGLQMTGGAFDLAIEGEGFFMVEGPNGPRLTRAGAFSTNAAGALVAADGSPVLDAGAAQIQIPRGVSSVLVSTDGAIVADGRPVAQVGIFTVADTGRLTREEGARFRFSDDPLPADGARVLQGFIEQSNVNPVRELTRMIDIQRSYEMGQSFLKSEDDRSLQSIRTLGGRA